MCDSTSKEVLVKVEGVSKIFCRDLKKSLLYGLKDSAKDLFSFRSKHNPTEEQSQFENSHRNLRPGEFWANKNISFELRRGECLGLIGRNGAGKTTLLKMLNGLIKPDTGRIQINGRIGALIALGAGFNPILSGRENIYVNGSVLGLTTTEIAEKIDDIIDFAEIRKFIDAPVQSYSSGMQVRLGFAIATALNPDVLLLDEVLAVGDASFRAKCYERISSMAEQTSIIFVSHNISQVSRLCPRSLYLREGCLHLDDYTSNCSLAYSKDSLIPNYSKARPGNKKAAIESIKIINKSGQSCSSIPFGEPFEIELTIIPQTKLDDIIVDISFRTTSNDLAAECNNFLKQTKLNAPLTNAKYRVSAKLNANLLNPGSYRLSCFLTNSSMTVHYDWWEDAAKLNSIDASSAIANIQLIADWDIQKTEN